LKNQIKAWNIIKAWGFRIRREVVEVCKASACLRWEFRPRRFLFRN